MNPTPEKTSVMAPFILMLFLYFIVGLFTVINQQFQVPLKSALLPHDGNMTNALVTLLNFSWFLAYPFSEGFATRWVDRLGYRRKNDSAATANDRRNDQFHRYGYRPAGGQLHHILRYSSPQCTIPWIYLARDLPDSDYLYFYPYNSQNQNAGN